VGIQKQWPCFLAHAIQCADQLTSAAYENKIIQLTAVRFCAKTNSEVQLFIVEQLTDQSNANDKTAKTNSVETEHKLHTDHN